MRENFRREIRREKVRQNAPFYTTHMILYLSLSNLFYNDLLKVFPLTQLNLADELVKLKGNIYSSKGSLKELFNESLSKMQDDEISP